MRTSNRDGARWSRRSLVVVLCVAGCGGSAIPGQSPPTGGGGVSDGGLAGSDGAVPAGPPTYAVTFQTVDTSQYLSSGSGGVLDASGNSVGATESFTLTDVNGGALGDGDLVYLAVAGRYLSAANGGGGALSFAATSAGDDETFVITRVDGAGAIAMGDHVAFKTKVGGEYVSAINGGGGDVLANAPWDKAWETYTMAALTGGGGGGGGSDGGTVAGSSARAKVLAYLESIQGHKSAIGIEDKSSSTPTSDSDRLASMAGTGDYPSFWSGDWGFGSDVADAREAIVKAGEAQWAKGAIVQYIYHACPLTMGANEYCGYAADDTPAGATPITGSSLDAQQWTDLITPGGNLNKVWLARLDVLATYFGELKAAGVAPLFRPLHEMNGAWAWWQNHPGPDGSARLYQITHDYLTITKGLDNIVWVWNVQDYTTLADDVGKYTPGPDYFDVAALDVYNTGFTTGNYDAMVGIAAGKPIGIAETYYMPDPTLMTNQPLWTYVAMWPDKIGDSPNPTNIPALFKDDQIVKLAQMPGWK